VVRPAITAVADMLNTVGAEHVSPIRAGISASHGDVDVAAATVPNPPKVTSIVARSSGGHQPVG
jgi:hypothetical protein